MMLKGLTWDHPRGFSPLVGGALEYQKHQPPVTIQWDRRSLREFGEAPIERYLDRYDLIIVDHPFVGFAARHDALVDLAPFLTSGEQETFAADSVGPSWESYWYAGGLWALPIDAATQVASYRPELLMSLSTTVPQSMEQVMDLGHAARTTGRWIVLPVCPTDAISLFFTLSANLGHPIPEETEVFAEEAVAREVLGRLHALVAVAHPKSMDWNPIQVYDFMTATSDIVYCPYGFGYSNYSRTGRSPSLKFTNAPAAGERGCAGTMLGGTGVAVSRRSRYPREAIAYAKWLTTPQHQAGTYFREGGQPASLSAWTDPAVDAASGGFFSATLPTLQTAYVRPRFNGFVRFFEAAGIEINRCLRGQLDDASLVRWLNGQYSVHHRAARQIA
jgi:multiple sugar transport system substrate-binding protein